MSRMDGKIFLQTLKEKGFLDRVEVEPPEGFLDRVEVEPPEDCLTLNLIVKDDNGIEYQIVSDEYGLQIWTSSGKAIRLYPRAANMVYVEEVND